MRWFLMTHPCTSGSRNTVDGPAQTPSDHPRVLSSCSTGCDEYAPECTLTCFVKVRPGHVLGLDRKSNNLGQSSKHPYFYILWPQETLTTSSCNEFMNRQKDLHQLANRIDFQASGYALRRLSIAFCKQNIKINQTKPRDGPPSKSVFIVGETEFVS